MSRARARNKGGAATGTPVVDIHAQDFSDDYCFDMEYERRVEVVTRLGGLSRADQARIPGRIAARLLRLR